MLGKGIEKPPILERSSPQSTMETQKNGNGLSKALPKPGV